MKPLIEGTNSAGNEVMIDLNDVKLNPAGTNMTVATYPEKEVDRGNTKPVYENYKSLRVPIPDDRKAIEDLFNLKVKEQAATKKQRELQISQGKKQTQRQILA